MSLEKIILFLFVCCAIVEAGRILVLIPTPSISHQIVFRPFTQELARRGHEVVTITTDAAFPKGQAPKNLTEIEIHDLSYKKWRDAILPKSSKGNDNDITKQLGHIMATMTEVFEIQMMNDDVQNILKKNKDYFDLIMIESYMKPAFVLAHVFKAPLILISSFGGFGNIYDLFGAPARPILLYPDMLSQVIQNCNLFEKIRLLYHHYVIEGILDKQKENDEKALHRLFGPETPSIEELEKKVDMFFLNYHPIWDYNRPVPPNIIYLGGMHQKPSKDLPNDLKSYLDKSKHGVIYISYGTNVDPTMFPQEKNQILVKTFSQLPYDVVYKWNDDELPGRPNNVRISKWLPQADLLKHPKIKLFITQGGLQSTDEAITAGVPLIGMPMLGDQWYNVAQYVHHKIGLRLDMDTLTEEKLGNAIHTVINDKSYRENVIRLRSIMTDQPQKPLDRAIWWTEHVMRHGGASHLRARAANMAWREYLDIDLWMFLGACALVGLIVIGYTAKLLLFFIKNILLRKSKQKSS